MFLVDIWKRLREYRYDRKHKMNAALLIYRKKTLLAKFEISETTLHRWMDDEDFPKPKQLGLRAVGWVVAQVTDWLEKRPVANKITNDGDTRLTSMPSHR